MAGRAETAGKSDITLASYVAEVVILDAGCCNIVDQRKVQVALTVPYGEFGHP